MLSSPQVSHLTPFSFGPYHQPCPDSQTHHSSIQHTISASRPCTIIVIFVQLRRGDLYFRYSDYVLWRERLKLNVFTTEISSVQLTSTHIRLGTSCETYCLRFWSTGVNGWKEAMVTVSHPVTTAQICYEFANVMLRQRSRWTLAADYSTLTATPLLATVLP